MSDKAFNSLMALIRHLRGPFVQAFRQEFAQLQSRSTPWSSVRDTIAAGSSGSSSSIPGPSADESALAFVLKTAAQRFVHNVAEAEAQQALAQFRSKIAGSLREVRLASSMLTLHAGAGALGWSDLRGRRWESRWPHTVLLGRLQVTLPADLQAALPDLDWRIELPALLPTLSGRALAMVAAGAAEGRALDCLHSIALRLLGCMEPGQVEVRILDPSNLSLGAAPWSSWTQSICADPAVVERELDAMLQRIERIAAQRLQGRWSTLREYHEAAESADHAAEPYCMCVVQGFPHSYSPESIRKIKALMRNGWRGGIWVLMHWQEDYKQVAESRWVDLVSDAVLLIGNPDGSFRWSDPAFSSCSLLTETLPDTATSMALVAPTLQVLQERQQRSSDYQSLSASADGGESSALEIRVPIGTCAASGQPVWMSLGLGIQHHALIIGGTGSGKSNLMNVVICGLAERYSPQELRFYLIDFKGGTAFKPYVTQQLPHAAVVALDCDRQYGLSVLEALHQVLLDRMKLIGQVRHETVDDFASYRKCVGPLPRILLVADEFQDLFAEEDWIAQRTRSILDDLLRKGRSFGINVFLGTQTLLGVATHSVSLQQIQVRLVLRCSPDDSRAALGHGNPAGSELKNPGEGIFNPEGGRLDANVRFRAPYLSAEQRVPRIQTLASAEETWDATVFEGNERVSLSRCPPFVQHATGNAQPIPQHEAATVWIGEPLAVQPPVEVKMDRVRGRNALAILQDAQAGADLLLNAMLCVLAQHRPQDVRLTVLDCLRNDSPRSQWVTQLSQRFAHDIERLTGRGAAQRVVELEQEVQRRMILDSSQQPPAHYLLVLGLQNCRELRSTSRYGEPEPGTPPGALLHLLRDGPECGVHVWAWCDQLTNLLRCGPLLEEFAVRISGPLPQRDSVELLGCGEAAAIRREHRLVLYDEDCQPLVRVIRPYTLPAAEFLAVMSEHCSMKGRHP